MVKPPCCLSKALLWPSSLFMCVIFLMYNHGSSLRSPLVHSTTITSVPQGRNDVNDGEALLFFKSLITEDPFGALTSWNQSLHYCSWQGITCGDMLQPQRVTSLKLDSLSLEGSISPCLSNLTFLARIHLPNNRLHGLIPKELGSLFHLKYLNLSKNSLDGQIPTTLGNCSMLGVIALNDNKLQGRIPLELSHCIDLRVINLGNNALVGGIPSELGYLSSLFYLNLSNNSLLGEIPAALMNISTLAKLILSYNMLSGETPKSIGKLSSLTFMDLSTNSLSGVIPQSIGNISSLTTIALLRNYLIGVIPSSLGNLSSLAGLGLSYNSLSGGIPSALGNLNTLTRITVSYNNLTGAIPSSLWNISSLIMLDLPGNKLTGTIPLDVGSTLPNLQILALNVNLLHGRIPMSISNSSRLAELQLFDNEFSGKIPLTLGALPELQLVVLDKNKLEAREASDWRFIDALTNCTRLRVLQLDFNDLEGMLPSSMANLSTSLEFLSIGDNQIGGEIPVGIGNLAGLTYLDMGPNLLQGTIPSSVGMLRSLHFVDLDSNRLSGEIPPSIGNLTQIVQLYLSSNYLNGSIPLELGNCQGLELLILDNNKLAGNIPKQVLTITGLTRVLSMSQNLLTGTLPTEVGSLKNLVTFDVSSNRLSGEIPGSLGECQLLQYLYMEDNMFQGTILSSFSALRGIQVLDLSGNNLSGPIPQFLQDFTDLYRLNLSFNNFEGEVPQNGVFANASAALLIGNNNLCGGNPKLKFPACPFQTQGKKHSFPMRAVIISVASGILCLMLIFFVLLTLHHMQKSQVSLFKDFIVGQQLKISYAKLSKATDGFSRDNLIGVGSFGSVYKGILDDGQIVAIKVLNLQQKGSAKSFVAECEVLRNVRHRNLVRILASCSSVDFKGNNFKALIFEYMSNGSLEDWLHHESSEQPQSRNLHLSQRLNVATEVALALDYLHNHNQVQVVHCDLKPSNILLNDDMVAQVGDFGLARLLTGTSSKVSHRSFNSMDLKGSIGYIAPEYGVASKISTLGDVYSYGILLLEMFTGKRPVDAAFKEGLTLPKFVEMALPEQVMDVIDNQLILEDSDEARNKINEKAKECIASVLQIGLLCSKESPTERLRIGDVTNRLKAIKDAYNDVERGTKA